MGERDDAEPRGFRRVTSNKCLPIVKMLLSQPREENLGHLVAEEKNAPVLQTPAAMPGVEGRNSDLPIDPHALGAAGGDGWIQVIEFQTLAKFVDTFGIAEHDVGYKPGGVYRRRPGLSRGVLCSDSCPPRAGSAV